MKTNNKIWFFLSIAIGLIAITLTINIKPEEAKKEIDFSQYVFEEDVYSEVYGEDTGTDFVPGHYCETAVNPYPNAIIKNIEATAYCYGTTTCTGKKVRTGYAAMSKEYIGMTAIVYTEDDNGNPLDYIGTYEIEDTGGDYRIKNGTCIDIYIDNYDEAKNFGRKDVVVYLIDAKG